MRAFRPTRINRLVRLRVSTSDVEVARASTCMASAAMSAATIVSVLYVLVTLNVLRHSH